MKKIPFIVLLYIFITSLTAPITFAQSFNQIVERHLGNHDISVSIRDVESGKIIFEKNGNTFQKPASTLKLLTAATALSVLGEDYQFTTEVFIDGDIQGDELKGNLYVKGGGDPTFQKDDFMTIADFLKMLGINKISGNLYGDDSMFAGPQLTPGVAKEDESYYYGARTSALTMSSDDDYDAGTIILHIEPTENGKKPTIVLDPNDSGMIIHNRAMTVHSDSKNTIEVERIHRSNEVVVSGNIPMGDPMKEWVTLQDPTINTLHALKEVLKEQGIMIEGVEVERKEIPEKATLLLTRKSEPLHSLVNPFMKLSNNSIADILVKTLGFEVYGEGSLENGLQVINHYGEKIGLHMDQWLLEDGSGISHKNRTTANELTSLLVKVIDEPYFKAFYYSLPIGGEEERMVGGSLRERFQKPHLKERIFAKTGHISGVYTLSGYAKTNSGKTVAFAVMTQHQSTVKLKDIDIVVEKIIEQY